MTPVWLAAGGAVGTLMRYWINLWITAWLGDRVPWGTIIVNITGSFLIGVFAATTAAGGRWVAPADMRLFLMVGICGGYTTFSSFSLQTLTLIETGEPLRALFNVVGSVVLGLAAVWIGYALFAGVPHGRG